LGVERGWLRTLGKSCEIHILWWGPVHTPCIKFLLGNRSRSGEWIENFARYIDDHVVSKGLFDSRLKVEKYSRLVYADRTVGVSRRLLFARLWDIKVLLLVLLFHFERHFTQSMGVCFERPQGRELHAAMRGAW
jgi:hypothetical protein